MTSSAVSSAPVTSWWYGQGGAVGVVRRLEALHTLAPAPATAGLVTARRDELTVTFVSALRAQLPLPWHPADTESEARIAWDAVDPGTPPDPQHPVYLVVFGTTEDGGLVAMNLAAFSRIRIDGERATTTALVSRWVLELLATHPSITVGVTDDVWNGPLTTRVRAVRVGQVPDVDVLICGPDLSYTDRAQIVSNATTSRIMVDLGKDAAVDTKWTITCGPDRAGQISNGQSASVRATLIVPSGDTVDRCCNLLTASPTATTPTQPVPAPDPAELDDPATTPSLSIAEPADELDTPYEGGIDFFDPQPGEAPTPDVADGFDDEPWRTDDDAPDDAAPVVAVAAPAAPAGDTSADAAVAAGPLPVVAPLWNRLLGQVVLCPPQPGQEPGPREKRLNELLVFLQTNPWASRDDIIRSIYGAAADRTVTEQMSQLRTRLGLARPGGPKALPPMRDGGFNLDSAVRSDWMEFERLVEILVETTPTSYLIAAMGLVTGPPLGGISPKDWSWTDALREQMRDRVPSAAVVLARRHYEGKKFSDAVEIARKGLWYDNARQDLWQVALRAALDGHEREAFKALRGQYLNTVAVADQDPAVLDLTKQAG